MILKYIFCFLIASMIAAMLGKPVIYLCRRLKLGQSILHYVDKHAGKQGTPTMGGWIFILPTIIAPIFFFDGHAFLAILSLVIMLCYGILGFLDDFIKIKHHHNEGLRPYQKIIGQVGIALVIAIYAYLKVGTSLQFFGLNLNLSFFIIPFVIFFFVAVTNSVNLLDGLDGLAGGVSAVYLLFFGLILAILKDYNLALISFGMVGALLGFLLYNGFPAKIFMGDTGSLALGGFIASVAVFSRTELILPIIGFLYVVTALSDIIQVAYYKKTHKRVFKMAPLHHHFEQLGVHENRIVLVYIITTMLIGITTLAVHLAIFGVV